jgi:hypothetical protein
MEITLCLDTELLSSIWIDGYSVEDNPLKGENTFP